jgi:predicted PurR-regulated permease PerM
VPKRNREKKYYRKIKINCVNISPSFLAINKKNCVKIMFISTSRCTSGLFCLVSLLFLIIVSNASGQTDNVTNNRQQQQQQQNNNKINSININNKKVPASSETQSDNLVLRQKHPNLNKKYETQSTVTSSLVSGIIFPSKKSE